MKSSITVLILSISYQMVARRWVHKSFQKCSWLAPWILGDWITLFKRLEILLNVEKIMDPGVRRKKTNIAETTFMKFSISSSLHQYSLIFHGVSFVDEKYKTFEALTREARKPGLKCAEDCLLTLMVFIISFRKGLMCWQDFLHKWTWKQMDYETLKYEALRKPKPGAHQCLPSHVLRRGFTGVSDKLEIFWNKSFTPTSKKMQ